MERMKEKELERLNHAQLCEIVLGLDPNAETKVSKAELKKLIIKLQDEVNSENQDEVNSENQDEVNSENQDEVNSKISQIVASRRQSLSTGIKAIGSTTEEKIAFRRASSGSTSSKSISAIIAERRKGL